MNPSSISGINWLYVPLLETGERCAVRVQSVDEQGGRIDVTGLVVECSSSDETVVRAEGGSLTGVRPGAAVITLKAVCGEQTFEVRREIRVVEAVKASAWTLKKERPSILFTPEQRQVLRGRFANPDGDVLGLDVRGILEHWKKQGEDYVGEQGFTVNYVSAPRVIDYELPPTEPIPAPQPAGYVDYPFWTMYSRGLEDRLISLSVLYSLTDEERYAERARQYLLAIADFHQWYEFDHRGAEGNLSNAHLVLGVATAYDLLHGYLSEKDRQIIRLALVEKGLRPLGVDYGNTDHHNIVVAKQVAMMVGALAIQDEEPHMAKYVAGPFAYMLDYLNRRAAAEETEGLMYDNIAARHIAQAAFALYKATGHDALSSHPYLTRLIPDKFFYFQAAGHRPSFANLSDCNPALDLAYLMSMLADHGNGAAMWYVQKYASANPVVLLNVTSGTQPVAPDDYFAGRKSQQFAPIGWAAMRSGWGERDHMLAFTSSPSARDHNHEDQNHFVMNVAGEWLITDPGYQDYVPGPRHDFTVGTVGHNALLVNGKGQAKRGGGRLTEWFAASVFSLVTGEAADSYGGALQSWQRSIVHVDEAYYLLVDEVAGSNPEDKLELLFHTKGMISSAQGELWPADGQVHLAKRVRFGGESASVYVAPCYPAALAASVSEYPGAEAYGPYLALQQQCDSAGSAVFATLLEPALDHTSSLTVHAERQDDVLHVVVQRSADSITDEIAVSLRDAGADADADALRAAGGTQYRGRAAWVSREAQALEAVQDPTKLALVSGTELRRGERQYLLSDRPASASVTYREGLVELGAALTESGSVSVYVPFEPVAVSGVPEGAVTGYDRLAKQLSLTLAAGNYSIMLRA